MYTFDKENMECVVSYVPDNPCKVTLEGNIYDTATICADTCESIYCRLP